MPTEKCCRRIWAVLSAAVVATGGMLVGEAPDLTLARRGEALARIVVPDGARPGAGL